MIAIFCQSSDKPRQRDVKGHFVLVLPYATKNVQPCFDNWLYWTVHNIFEKSQIPTACEDIWTSLQSSNITNATT